MYRQQLNGAATTSAPISYVCIEEHRHPVFVKDVLFLSFFFLLNCAFPTKLAFTSPWKEA